MPKKDKAKAKQQAEDARGAVTEEVSKTVDDAQHAAGGVTSSLKDAVETVAETTTHVLRHPPVSSAID
jgi:gas vesicle protein